jgi:hypothetical protein
MQVALQYPLSGVQDEWPLRFSPSNRVSEFDAA